MWIWSGDITTGLREYEAGLLNESRGKGVENHLGDILTYTKDFDEHLAPVEVVLSSLQSAGLSVNFLKSRWCCASLEFVGIPVDRQGFDQQSQKPQR